MSTALTSPLSQEQWVFLSGPPPMGEYLGFIKSNAADEESVNLQTLSDEWRAANDRIHELEVTEAGGAGKPTIGEIPEDFHGFTEQVTANPMFLKTFSLVPSSFGIGELDRLIVFQ